MQNESFKYQEELKRLSLANICGLSYNSFSFIVYSNVYIILCP